MYSILLEQNTFVPLTMETPLIDIHTHTQSNEEGIFRLVNRIVSKDYVNDRICSAGIHPWYIDIDVEAQFQALEQYAQKKSVIAIGECGLDKLHNLNWDRQAPIFERQIVLANNIQKPLIIHCVRAYQEVMHHLKEQKVSVPVFFHGFNKKIELAHSLLDHGYFLGLGPSILKGQQDELIRNIPLDHFFLETDDKSTKIVDIYLYFCAVRKISLEQLKHQLTQNLLNVFRYNIEV